MNKTLDFKDFRKRLGESIDNRVRIITAGMNIKELRAVLRGDPPTVKPNPRYRVHTTSFLFHIRPRYYEQASTIFTHTFRLGFFTVFFMFVELLTGLILMIYYTPSPAEAYSSILSLSSNVPYGKLLRDVHRLGAEAMVVFTALHMLRTYLTGSYKKERSFTWLTGVVLLGVTLFLSFSGYLLPWDQLAYWAVTIGTSMAEAAPLFGEQVNLLLRGAPDIAAGGLLRFYLLHIVLLPFAAILVLSIHYYKVGREHGISLPAKYVEGDVSPTAKKEAKRRVDFIPDLLTSEIFWVSLGILVIVLGVTVFGYSAPLENIANPQQTPLDTKAPWYFWWLQGMLKLGDKTLMGIIIPTVLVLLLLGIPYIDRNRYRSLYKRPVAIGIGLLAVIALVVLSYMGLPQYNIQTPAATRIIQDLAPEEGVGPLREIPYDQLETGIYITGEEVPRDICPNLTFGCPELTEVFGEFSDLISYAATAEGLPDYEQLPNGEGVMTIADWQDGLAKITMRISWDDPNTAAPKLYEKHIFLHQDRINE